jgi:hypothetical protein
MELLPPVFLSAADNSVVNAGNPGAWLQNNLFLDAQKVLTLYQSDVFLSACNGHDNLPLLSAVSCTCIYA